MKELTNKELLEFCKIITDFIAALESRKEESSND